MKTKVINLEKESNKHGVQMRELPKREYAMNHPNSFRSKLWQWHTKWCPGWKAYQKELNTAEKVFKK